MSGIQWVESAEEFPETPGAIIVVMPEGGDYPRGYFRPVAIVRAPLVPVSPREDGWPMAIEMLAPLPSQHWWDRYYQDGLRVDSRLEASRKTARANGLIPLY